MEKVETFDNDIYTHKLKERTVETDSRLPVDSIKVVEQFATFQSFDFIVST